MNDFTYFCCCCCRNTTNTNIPSHSKWLQLFSVRDYQHSAYKALMLLKNVIYIANMWMRFCFFVCIEPNSHFSPLELDKWLCNSLNMVGNNGFQWWCSCIHIDRPHMPHEFWLSWEMLLAQYRSQLKYEKSRTTDRNASSQNCRQSSIRTDTHYLLFCRASVYSPRLLI